MGDLQLVKENSGLTAGEEKSGPTAGKRVGRPTGKRVDLRLSRAAAWNSQEVTKHWQTPSMRCPVRVSALAHSHLEN